MSDTLDSALRRLRIAHDAEAAATAAAKAAETELRQATLEARLAMEASGLDKVSAYGLDLARVTKTVYNMDAAKWPDLYARIRMTGEFDLLQKRIALTAVAARMKMGDLLPGIMEVQLPELKVTTSKVYAP